MKDNITDLVLSLLGRGEENAVTSEYLMQRTGLSRRCLQRVIHDLRMNGQVIISKTSGSGGYWLAADPAEAQRFVDSMTHRGLALFAAVKSARQMAKGAE